MLAQAGDPGSGRPAILATMAVTGAALDQVRNQVNETLTRFMERQRRLATGIAGELAPAMDALAGALTGGKRLRAAFCYWGWRGAGGDHDRNNHDDRDRDGDRNSDRDKADDGYGGRDDAVLTAAAALELLHASALVHDDVLDGSDTRRGRPTVHRRFAAQHDAMGWHGSAGHFGTSVAILLGDLLLTWTDELYHSSGLPDAALRRGRPILDVMRTEVMAGQYLDLLEQASADGTVAGALRVIRFKTAKYTIERPLHLGAALAGDDTLMAGYTAYGMPLGVAFQLRDDVLGVFGDPAETGKPAGDDIREGKRTVLTALARERATTAQAGAIGRLLGNPAIDESGIAEFRDLLTGTGALAECETMIGRYTAEALAALDRLPAPAEAKAALAELAVAATTRRL
jgi:geranylgeranyl diphosphate synthase, type I